MLLIALDPEGDTEFTGDLWPSDPTPKAFTGVFFEGYWYLKDFWLQFGNSFFIGATTHTRTLITRRTPPTLFRSFPTAWGYATLYVNPTLLGVEAGR